MQSLINYVKSFFLRTSGDVSKRGSILKSNQFFVIQRLS